MDIKDVSFSYDNKINRLHRVNAEIELGKITTIIGPNGCGKSTLLSVMSNNNLPQEGQVILEGKEISRYKPKDLAKKLAVVHQQNEAPTDMTVERLTSYGRLPHKGIFSSDSKEDARAIEWALTSTNLQDMRQTPIDSLSGGEKQRVWIAMTLAQSTPFLFLDEPTTYLDIYYQYEILELISRYTNLEELNISIVNINRPKSDLNNLLNKMTENNTITNLRLKFDNLENLNLSYCTNLKHLDIIFWGKDPQINSFISELIVR